MLPYVQEAFERAVEEIEAAIPREVQNGILPIIRYLCDPDPRRRGHPEDLGCNQFSLERVISAFDLIATRAEYGLLKA